MSVPEPVSVATLVALLEQWFAPSLAEEWDRIGLVLGDQEAPVTRVLLVVDVVPETVAQAIDVRAQLIVSHHPLLLRPVSSLAQTTYKGRIVHQLIRSNIALFTAHTNADNANPGVSDALAHLLGLRDLRPLSPLPGDPAQGTGRIGHLPAARPLAEVATDALEALPATPWGIRVAGQPDQLVETVAVCGGAGESLLATARAAGADAYLTSDLRHHPASEHICDGGPALLDAAHWATERPWLDAVAARLSNALPIETIVSDLVTDPWTVRVPPRDAHPTKEPRL